MNEEKKKAEEQRRLAAKVPSHTFFFQLPHSTFPTQEVWASGNSCCWVFLLFGFQVDNIRDRALDDMMGGVLELKKEDILKMVLSTGNCSQYYGRQNNTKQRNLWFQSLKPQVMRRGTVVLTTCFLTHRKSRPLSSSCPSQTSSGLRRRKRSTKTMRKKQRS